jgi:hypothetical protein
MTLMSRSLERKSRFRCMHHDSLIARRLKAVLESQLEQQRQDQYREDQSLPQKIERVAE